MMNMNDGTKLKKKMNDDEFHNFSIVKYLTTTLSVYKKNCSNTLLDSEYIIICEFSLFFHKSDRYNKAILIL